MKVYKGIRYATAERLKKPVMDPDVEDIDRIELKEIICHQSPSKLEYLTGPVLGGLEQGEDCLRLNIFTPSTEGNLPVVVFVHGGAFVAGSGLLPIYDATELAEELNCVVVTISYRLGVFGFLYLPDEDAVNLGLEDIICSFRWVKRNIKKFGGNPDDVTALGHSSGAYCIANIMAQVEEPLFQKARLLNCPISSHLNHKKGMKMTSDYLKLLGSDIRTAEISQIMRAQGELMGKYAPRPPFNVVGPNVASMKIRMKGVRIVHAVLSKGDDIPFGPGKITPIVSWMLFNRPTKTYIRNLTKSGIDADILTFKWKNKGKKRGTSHCIVLPLLFGKWEEVKVIPMMAGVSREDYLHHHKNAIKILKMFVFERHDV